ncbi:MAG: hypothetical protein HY868_11170 [Chloroflexi bacterium]|nr:hypothetical protein [Chloroflexota bacterium]
MVQTQEVPNDWWPELLRPILAERPLDHEQVLVAEIGHPWGPRSYRHLYSALAPSETVSKLLEYPGGIGHEISTTGPHPDISSSQRDSNYVPRFWVFAAEVVPEGLEPLVISWRSANQNFIAPDQGFLMTYGLIPRIVTTETGPELHWDDPSVPKHDVVVSRNVSVYDFPNYTRAFVTIQRDYLHDYATIRDCHIIQVYYAERWGEPSSNIVSLLAGREAREFTFPGRLIEIRNMSNSRPSHLAKVWGTRALIEPNDSPVIAGRWQYGELVWPGIQDPVTNERALPSMLLVAFVSDAVLAHYEGNPQFQIHPESGNVSYGNQWSTGNTQRVGRDLILVELKKLYEGCPPNVVHYWHRYAVLPSAENLDRLRQTPNVATRAKRITYALVSVGEALAKMATEVFQRALNSKEIVGLSRQEMNYRGWWNDPIVEPVTRTIPLSMSKDDFLARCESLDQLVVEGLQERILREILLGLGEGDKDILQYKSIRLLGRLLELSTVANQSGLWLGSDFQEIHARTPQPARIVQLPVLATLHDLRIVRSHRGNESHQKRVSDALKVLNVDPALTATGWGTVMDALLDAIAKEIEHTFAILKQGQLFRPSNQAK